MNEQEKRSLSVYLIALAVILSNLVILSVLYRVPGLSTFPAIKKALVFISLAAVYPQDFLQNYFRSDLAIHFFWILSVILSAFGLLFFNRYARLVFITFNILNFVLLCSLTLFSLSRGMSGDLFFKCYFNLVAFLIYVGYLTLPEIKEQFEHASEKIRFDLLFLKWRRKTLGPSDAVGFYNLGLAYRKLGRMDEAFEFLSRAVQVMPGHAEYNFQAGLIEAEREHYSEAIQYLKDAIRLDPLHSRARQLLGQVYEKTGCLEEAIQSYRRVTFLEATKGEVFLNLGMTCFKAGHWEEAQQALRKAMTLEPQNHLATYYLGLIVMRDEKVLDDAEELFKKTVRLKPDFIDAYNQLGNLYVQQAQYKNAIRAYRDVLRLNPNSKDAHYQLGFVYAMMRDLESARREYNYLKDIDPDLAKNLSLLLK